MTKTTTSKITAKSAAKSTLVKSSFKIGTNMKKIRKRVTFKGIPNSNTNSFDVSSLRSSLLDIENPKKAFVKVKPYFKRASKKLFPTKEKPKGIKLQPDPKPILFYAGIWLCDRCGWMSQNEHWCPNLTKAELQKLVPGEESTENDSKVDQEDFADDEASFIIEM